MADTREESTDIEEVEQAVKFLNPEALLAVTYEEALIGYVEIPGHTALALYDRTHCIKILMERDGMDAEGARDYFEHNVMGSEMTNAPGFATITRLAGVAMPEGKEGK